VDALSPFGITHLDIPITPFKVFKALKEKGVFDK
jgi:carbon-monoxide dehydrogenase large subunit